MLVDTLEVGCRLAGIIMHKPTALSRHATTTARAFVIIITTLAEAKELGEEQLGLPTENEELVVRFRSSGTTEVCVEAKKEEIK